jgi:hypothetical protein
MASATLIYLPPLHERRVVVNKWMETTCRVESTYYMHACEKITINWNSHIFFPFFSYTNINYYVLWITIAYSADNYMKYPYYHCVFVLQIQYYASNDAEGDEKMKFY